MPATPPLPGFERLIKICHRHQLPLELSSPLSTAPKGGELIFDQAFDPQLATIYQRTGEATLGSFTLFPPHHGHQGLFAINEHFKRDGEEPFRSTLVFGQKTGFSYYLGTVPALADAQGLQPVIYMPYYPGERSGLPIASTVDRFFDTYSHYLELMVVDAEYVGTGVPEISFPWDVAPLVVQDTALMSLVSAERFVPLMDNNRDAQEWVDTLLTTRP